MNVGLPSTTPAQPESNIGPFVVIFNYQVICASWSYALHDGLDLTEQDVCRLVPASNNVIPNSR